MTFCRKARWWFPFHRFVPWFNPYGPSQALDRCLACGELRLARWDRA